MMIFLNKFKPICWHLPRPSSRYPGSYPLNFEEKFLKFTGLDKRKLLHVFSGWSKLGIRIDLRLELKPDIVADAHHLPFRDNVFPGILADPPYDDDYAKSLYGTPKLKPVKYMKEMIRVLQKGGILAVYHWYIPIRPKDCRYRGAIAILLMPWKKARIVTFFEKDLHESQPLNLDKFI